MNHLVHSLSPDIQAYIGKCNRHCCWHKWRHFDKVCLLYMDLGGMKRKEKCKVKVNKSLFCWEQHVAETTLEFYLGITHCHGIVLGLAIPNQLAEKSKLKFCTLCFPRNCSYTHQSSVIWKKLERTKSCISTVTKPTHWCPFKFIHEKICTLPYLDVSMPMAAASTPMEAHFPVDNLPDVLWMGTT